MSKSSKTEPPASGGKAHAGQSEGAPKESAVSRWRRRIVNIAIGLVVSLVIGKIIETVGDKEWLQEAIDAQKQWIDTVWNTSPVGVATLYWTEVTGAFSGDASGGSWTAQLGSKNWLFAPLLALITTVWRSFDEGGVVVLIEIGIGALAVAVFNFIRSNRDTIFFDSDALTIQNVLFMPIAIMISASVLGMALWAVMIGALYLLSWITGFAAWAAAATGLGGFCYLCATKLGEKGLEHVMTPEI